MIKPPFSCRIPSTIRNQADVNLRLRGLSQLGYFEGHHGGPVEDLGAATAPWFHMVPMLCPIEIITPNEYGGPNWTGPILNHRFYGIVFNDRGKEFQAILSSVQLSYAKMDHLLKLAEWNELDAPKYVVKYALCIVPLLFGMASFWARCALGYQGQTTSLYTYIFVYVYAQMDSTMRPKHAYFSRRRGSHIEVKLLWWWRPSPINGQRCCQRVSKGQPGLGSWWNFSQNQQRLR